MSDSINAIGFDLARQFRDPAFRDRVRALGYTTEPMVLVLPDATLQSVLDRIGDAAGRCLLARSATCRRRSGGGSCGGRSGGGAGQ